MGPRSAGSRSSCRIFSTVGQSRESWRICSQRLLVTKIYVGQCSSIQCLWRNDIESNNRQFTASMRIRCSEFPFIHSFYIFFHIYIYIYGQIDNSRFQIRRFSSDTFFKVIFHGEVRAWKWESNISNERVANNGEGTFYYRRSRVEEKNLNLLNHLLERDELQDRLAMEESISNRRFPTDESMKNLCVECAG